MSKERFKTCRTCKGNGSIPQKSSLTARGYSVETTVPPKACKECHGTGRLDVVEIAKSVLSDDAKYSRNNTISLILGMVGLALMMVKGWLFLLFFPLTVFAFSFIWINAEEYTRKESGAKAKEARRIVAWFEEEKAERNEAQQPEVVFADIDPETNQLIFNNSDIHQSQSD